MEETQESLHEQINSLWHEHYKLPFPEGLGGREVNGIDLVLLDSDIAGCVSTFIDRGDLDTWRAAVLGLCYRDCSFVCSVINNDAAEYFRRLESMAGLVLRLVAIKNCENRE